MNKKLPNYILERITFRTMNVKTRTIQTTHEKKTKQN